MKEKNKTGEIIDFELRGNVVRFYLGKNGKQWGDDWNDRPYEHNAGKVYDEFIKGYKDVVFSFDTIIVEPCEGHNNSPFCKQDMIERKVPCIVIIEKLPKGHYFIRDSFEKVLAHEKAKRYYFGDVLK